jgi:Fe2+ or Zn2+ uptake regulation protein
MGKQDRKLQTLEMLVKADVALTPQVLFLNLKRRGATFERRSVTTYLNELKDAGYVEKIDINERFNMYQATDDGREYFCDKRSSLGGWYSEQGGGKTLTQR